MGNHFNIDCRTNLQLYATQWTQILSISILMLSRKIRSIRRIKENAKGKHFPAALFFIDFSKAFDTIHRKYKILVERANTIWHRWHKLLWNYGVVQARPYTSPIFINYLSRLHLKVIFFSLKIHFPCEDCIRVPVKKGFFKMGALDIALKNKKNAQTCGLDKIPGQV